MSAVLENVEAIYYPSTDGKPMGETDWHILLIMDLRKPLEAHFRNDENAYVASNLLLYYEEGKPKKFIVPDVMFARGVKKQKRRIYKLWEEGKPPDVVVELASKETWRKDIEEKRKLYARLGVKEYYVFDPEYLYLPTPFLAYKLVDGVLAPVAVEGGRVLSEALGLELVDTGTTLRLFNPQTEEFLLTPDEAEDALHEEQVARLEAENEVERLRAELAKLKAQKE
jgi:Uma2 family endonuclease